MLFQCDFRRNKKILLTFILLNSFSFIVCSFYEHLFHSSFFQWKNQHNCAIFDSITQWNFFLRSDDVFRNLKYKHNQKNISQVRVNWKHSFIRKNHAYQMFKVIYYWRIMMKNMLIVLSHKTSQCNIRRNIIIKLGFVCFFFHSQRCSKKVFFSKKYQA